MIITPLRPQAPKPVALLVPAWRSMTAYTVEGERHAAGPRAVYDLLASLEHHVLYVGSNLRGLINATGSSSWTAEVWRGRAVSMTLDGTEVKVTSLRRTLSGAGTPAEQFSVLLEVVEYLAHQGVRAGSLSSMAWRLWRITLSESITLGFNPKVSRRAFFGGRKEMPGKPHAYHDQVAVDIASAYPHAMVSKPYGGILREVSTATTLDPDVAGLAQVRAVVPRDLRFPTLPVRVAPSVIQWRYGDISGVYTWAEIEAARSVGTEVEVERVWAPITEVSPFAAWWDVMLHMQASLSPSATKLVKALSNLVWSHFAMTGDDSATIRWADDLGEYPVTAAKAQRPMPQANCVHLAAETSSRVRVRMLLEGLYGDSEPPAHVDTDGMIVSRASYIRRDTGNEVGEWRAKTFMDLVELRAPQLYRYTCGRACGVEHSRYHYVAAGTPSRLAAELFEGKHPGFQISMNGLDTVLPSGDVLTPDQRSRYLAADDTLQRLVYGEPLVAHA